MHYCAVLARLPNISTLLYLLAKGRACCCTNVLPKHWRISHICPSEHCSSCNSFGGWDFLLLWELVNNSAKSSLSKHIFILWWQQRTSHWLGIPVHELCTRTLLLPNPLCNVIKTVMLHIWLLGVASVIRQNWFGFHPNHHRSSPRSVLVCRPVIQVLLKLYLHFFKRYETLTWLNFPGIRKWKSLVITHHTVIHTLT